MLKVKFTVPIKGGKKIDLIGVGRTVKEALVHAAKNHPLGPSLNELISGPVNYWIIVSDVGSQEEH